MGVVKCPHGFIRSRGEFCSACQDIEYTKRLTQIQKERRAVKQAVEEAVKRGEAFLFTSIDGSTAITVIPCGKGQIDISLDEGGDYAEAIIDAETAAKIAEVLAPSKNKEPQGASIDRRVVEEIAAWIAAIGGMINADRLAKQIARWPVSSTCAARSGVTEESEINVYEAAARIVRATIDRELTKDEARRLRGFTDAGAFFASWGAFK